MAFRCVVKSFLNNSANTFTTITRFFVFYYILDRNIYIVAFHYRSSGATNPKIGVPLECHSASDWMKAMLCEWTLSCVITPRPVAAATPTNGVWGRVCAGQSAAESVVTCQTTARDVAVNFAGVKLPPGPRPSAWVVKPPHHVRKKEEWTVITLRWDTCSFVVAVFPF